MPTDASTGPHPDHTNPGPSGTLRQSTWQNISKPVFLPAVLIILAALGIATWIGAVHGDEAEAAFTNLRDSIGTTIGWWYILVVTACLVFSFWAALSKVGRVRLGRDDERPQFSRLSWFAMLFSAGMGIGLVFNGVAEPLSHLIAPPEVMGVAPSSEEASRAAIGEALFHWGLHAWGIYALVGLGLSYMTFRCGRPLSVRWLLEPVMGRRLTESWVGHTIDAVAVIGTVFGVATSLGMGVLQIQAGLVHLGWFEPSNLLIVALVAGITAIGTFSVVSGVDRGIRWLSNTNMGLAAVLAAAVMLIGPTVFILRSLVQNVGEYAQTIPQLAFVTGAGADDGWTLSWTLFNQAWFLSWAPFVGMFIARISRGRTIREFILGVLLAPTAVSIVWFTVFGSTSLLVQLESGSLVGEDGVINTDTTLFQFFAELPVSGGIITVLSVVAIIVIMLFFITSADSCSLVVDVLSHGGRSETPRITRVFWALLVGAAGGVLLLAGGEAALTVLQVSSLAGAGPLSLVYALAMVALWRMFRYEMAVMPRYVHVTAQGPARGGGADAPSAAAGTAPRAGEAEPSSALSDRSMREMVREHEHALAGPTGVRGVSASLAGLARQTGTGVQESAEADPPTVLAVRDLAADAVTVDTANGMISVDEEATPHDPIGGEVFDTPEFSDSAIGASAGEQHGEHADR